MPKIILHTGPFRSFYFFHDAIRENQDTSLAILPVNRAVRIFKKTLIDQALNLTLANPPVFTFDELLLKIYRQLPGAKRVISVEMTRLLIENILNESQSGFNYLNSGKKISAGMVRKINVMISELRRFGYDNHSFRKIDPAAREDQPLKFNDFELLLTHLDKKLGARMIDEPFALHQAARMVTKEHFNVMFPGLQTVFISGYGLFTPAMFDFIEKAAQWCVIHIKLDHTKRNEVLFAHTADAYNRFIKMGAQIEESPAASDLAERLFNRDLAPSVKLDFNNRVLLRSAEDRDREVAIIAAQIRQIHLNDQRPLHKIAVTFSNMERYVPLIRKIFKAYQIPYNLSTGFNLLQSPLIRMFINTLRLIEQKFRFADCWQYFNSSLIRMPESYNPNLVYKLCVENRIAAMDRVSLTNFKGWLENRYKDLPAETPDFENPVSQIEILIQALQPYFDFPSSADAAGFRSAYIGLLKQTGLLNWYESPDSHLTERERENEFRAFNRFIKSFDKLIWTLNYLYQAREMTLRDFIGYLQAALDQANYNLTEFPDYGVQIMPRLEIQALDFDILFIGGLTDGEFPRASAKDIFFSDPLRDKIGLVAAEELLDQDRFIFYTLLDSKANKIILTHPGYEGDKALVPSTFISDLTAIAEVDSKDENDPANRLNPAELLKTIGFDIADGKAGDAKVKSTHLINSGVAQSDALLWTFKRIERSFLRVFENRFTTVEGRLDEIEPVQKILTNRFADRTWSATMLEAYGFCPMQFFLSQVLKIEDRPDLEQEITSMERGIVIHKILFRFYQKLKGLNAAHRPAEHPALLKKIATEVFDQLPFRGLFWELERQIYFGSDKSRGLLDTFIEYDQEQIAETGYKPDLFEFGFGYTADSEKDEASATRAVILEGDEGRIRINGKIDRIDTDNNGNALIFDYKTGVQSASVKISEIIEGTRFQLPLYLLAFEQMRQGLNARYAGYYLVKDAENCKRKEALADKESIPFLNAKSDAGLPNPKFTDADGVPFTLDSLIRLSLNQAIRKVNELQSGVFRHTLYPDAAGCERYCAFKRICQKNIGKIKRLNAKEETN